MDRVRLVTLLAVSSLISCGSPPADRPSADGQPHSGTPSPQAVGAGPAAPNPLSAEVDVEPEIARAWVGIRVEVSPHELGDPRTFDAMMDEPVELGDTGLTLIAEAFLPDFVMHDGGIRNRSPEPHNPAARVTITAPGSADYQGWLFAAMPGIPPYPHPEYRVVLVEGIPADTGGN